MLKGNPDLPIFVLSEVNANPAKLLSRLGFSKMKHEKLAFVQQWKELSAKKKLKYNPLHILLNVLSMTIFPFAASPLLRDRTGMSVAEFNALMEERKKLIPMWIHDMLK